MGSFTGTVPSFVPGKVRASNLQTLADLATALSAPWTSAVPTWTASAGSVAIGNGSLAGRYRKVGKTVDWQWILTAGTTTTYGTAGSFWSVGIPGGGTAAGFFHGSGWFIDSSTGNSYVLTWRLDSGASSMRLWRTASGVTPSELLNNSPVTIATGDSITCNGTVEIA